MNTNATILGVDLGGTKTALALYDAKTLERKAEQVLPTDAERGFEAVRADLLAEIDALRATDTVAVGVGVPGLVRADTHRVLTMPNIPGAEGADLRADIALHTGLPVVIENDARCFAFAEALVGAGKGHRVVVGVTLGTGVGGGIVIDGKLYHGARGFAGEVGHMLLMPGKPPYAADDDRGSAEQFLSGTALGRRCKGARTPAEYLEGEAGTSLKPQVFRELAWLVTDLTYALDPSIIVFGGSVGRALKPYLQEIESELRHWLLAQSQPPVITCGILDDAARRGAALLARQAMTE
ncbi:MAG: ROK family protein [Candidatus Peribacteraceae bacterium]